MTNIFILLSWFIYIIALIRTFMKMYLLHSKLTTEEPTVFRLLGSPSGLSSRSAAQLISYCFKVPNIGIHQDVINAAKSLKAAFLVQIFTLAFFLLSILAA